MAREGTQMLILGTLGPHQGTLGGQPHSKGPEACVSLNTRAVAPSSGLVPSATVLRTSEAMESGVQKAGRPAGTPVNTSCLWSREHPASRPPTGEPAGAPQPGSEPLTSSNPKGNSRVSLSGVHSHKVSACFHAANALEPRCFGNKQQTRSRLA